MREGGLGRAQKPIRSPPRKSWSCRVRVQSGSDGSHASLALAQPTPKRQTRTEHSLTRASECSITILPHQEQAFGELLATARVLREQRWQGLSIKPRLNVLVVGSTGTGKTAIVRALAETIGAPLFEVSTGTWVLVGTSARGAVATWPALYQFLKVNTTGVIFVDEIDKVSGSTDWTTYLRSELFSLLDRTLPRDLFSASDLLENSAGEATLPSSATRKIAQSRLREGMLIVGAGAFQSHWEMSEAREVGFNARETRSESSRPALSAISRFIPPELGNRFRARVVYLPTLRFGDYLAILRQSAQRLPPDLAEPFLERGFATIFDAVDSRLGTRWLEELLTDTLASLPPLE